MAEAETTTSDVESSGRRFRLPRFRWILAAVLAVVLLLWVVPVLVEAISGLDITIDRPYLMIFAFVTFDAVIPIFPSESLLHAASSLAAQGDLTLGYIILAAGCGAVVGDSLLYWLSRTIGRSFLSRQLEKAEKNDKARTAFDVLGDTAPLLITLGRFVVGVRFAVNVTMGVTRYPYRKFLLFDIIGGFAWAAYTCVISFWIGEALSDYPLLSILVGVLLTTVILAILYIPLKRRYEQAKPEEAEAAEPA